MNHDYHKFAILISEIESLKARVANLESYEGDECESCIPAFPACPFCACAGAMHSTLSESEWWVECRNCGARGSVCESPMNASYDWSSRKSRKDGF